MNKTLLLLSFILAFAVSAYSQALHIDSTRFITGDNCCIGALYAIPTADKGILFMGYEAQNPGGIIPPFSDVTYWNVLVGKMNSNHQIDWVKVYGGSNDDAPVSACQTPDGGYAVLCTILSADGDVTGFKGTQDIWLLRLDGSGNLLWQKTYGSSLADQAVSIANAPDGGFIIAGTTNGSNGDVPFHYGGYFQLDWLVIKTDANGNVQWSKDLGSTGDEATDGSILAIDNAYYLISATDSNNHDCTDIAWHGSTYTRYNYYVLKLDETGTVLWNRSYGGSSGEVAMEAFFDVRDSTMMIVGTTTSSDYMVTTAYGLEDIWVIKMNKNGDIIWQKTLGSANPEEGIGICPAYNGGYLVYGSTRWIIGGGDLWLFMLDMSGNKVADKIFGGTDNEIPNSIVPFATNEYAAIGFGFSESFTEGVNFGRLNNSPTAFVSFFKYWPVGLSDPSSLQEEISLQPNPANDLVKIVLPTNASGHLVVFNAYGKIFYNTTLTNTPFVTINTSCWAAGVYLLQWRNENGLISNARLIKQ